MPTIAPTIKYFLSRLDVDYQVLIHPRVGTPLQTATSANISPEQLAYAVLLKDKKNYLIAILPSSNVLDLNILNLQLNKNYVPATLSEEKKIFKDCTLGMVPAIGEAYGIDSIVDNALDNLSAIYLPTGNNSTLIRVNEDEFHTIQVNALHGTSISENNIQFSETYTDNTSVRANRYLR